MASVDDGGGSGRNVSVDVNIIPFIDLMSVIIIFLLITAVWTQVSMIQLGSSVYGKAQEPSEPPKEIDPPIPVEVYVTANSYIITLDKKKYTIAKITNGTEETYDKKSLFDQLKAFKLQFADKKDAMVTVADDVIYNDMVEAMDVMMQAGFPEIIVATGG
jgi:biopolymer transport protein TolR